MFHFLIIRQQCMKSVFEKFWRRNNTLKFPIWIERAKTGQIVIVFRESNNFSNTKNSKCAKNQLA